MKKKILSVLLVAAMAISMAACGLSAPAGGDNNAAGTEAGGTTATADATSTVTAGTTATAPQHDFWNYV